MPFARPSLTEIIDRVIADISNRITGVDSAVLRRSLLGILGRAEAGTAHLLYGYIDWVAKQVIPDTAESEFLERWSAIWDIQRKPAEFAAGSATFTGSVGSIIPDGTIVQRQDGAQYTVLADVTFVTGTATVSVQALVAGEDANQDAGARLTLLSPIAGVQAAGTVAAGGIVNGTDVESDDRLRERLLQRIQNPPQGGSAADYVTWGLQVPGVTRVWVYPMQMGPGTVTVLFATDDDPDGIIPGPAKVAEVQAHIDAVRPVTAEVFVAAPIAAPINPSIAIRPNTPTVQAAVVAELEDLIVRDAVPAGKILISRMREAVSIAAGEDNNEFISPNADVTNATGHISTLGTVTFSTLGS
jgi:uncharacterized phage protein gp47/JayE